MKKEVVIMKVKLNCGKEFKINLPDKTDVLSMKTPTPLADPLQSIHQSLENPIKSEGLDNLIKRKIRDNKESRAVVVISDNTRPVPYKGEAGILLPIIEKLLKNGVKKGNIIVLVATGTHRALTKEELKEMIDPEVFELGIEIKNHDCNDQDNLVYLGETSRKSMVYINKDYMQADIKILTGLVESHFMAGVSGGRKSVCPGLIGEKSTYVFHGAEILSSPKARDLFLDGNPCHEEALEVAQKAGVDFIVNVTLDHDFNVTGVFSGDLEEAHKAAMENVREYVAIPVDKEYDIVATHAGFVGINHYQAAKVGVVSIPLLKADSKLIVAADNIDDDTIGSINYKTALYLLKRFGAEKFKKLILSSDWGFIPEQWQVQMWGKLFSRIRQDNMIYYSPQFSQGDYQNIPGLNGNKYLPVSKQYKDDVNNIPLFIENAVNKTIEQFKKQGREEIDIAYLIDGPYGVPIRK
ncbi:nickel-dependent lactate racemase [Iocasia frigidifontis]|uniref:Nickel-dependent lactate racemase n=2 Tax=Iocasia fonsfrigidae TaxID=2682810 RepID=A0A8A7KH87_9FIRM|nr:nickel-dependent lactate racemase [Iocasia fonsfrigidae]